MKIIKVVYDDDTQFILDIVSKAPARHLREFYNTSIHKDKKKARLILERHGTKNLPLVVLENENLDEYAAIWSEQNPDWLNEINKFL